MNKLFRTCALLLLIAGCHSLPSLPPLPGMLNPSKLPSQLLAINTERDTTLSLKSGTIITIPAHALKADGNIAELEVKEAVTIEQMLLSGLRTRSNGIPLQSGGMIYINSVKDANVSILKPLQIQVPAAQLKEGMQLYQGKIEENGVNWIAPQPLPAKPDTAVPVIPGIPAPEATPVITADEKSIQHGKTLFIQNCAACHSVTRQITGPALKGVTQRWADDTTGIYSFIRNSGAMIASGHKYAVDLFNMYNEQAMPGFPSFTNTDIRNILAYIEDASLEYENACEVPGQVAMPDSCQYYNTVFALANEMQDDDHFINITNTIEDAGVTLLTTASIQIEDTLPASAFKNLVTPKANRSYYYTLNIDTFGWYNIDMALKKDPDMPSSELTVSIPEKEDQSISVFLVIPSHKIMVEGGYLKNGKLYGFHEEDGSIPLPQGVKAYIVAIGENKNSPQLYFGRTSFITSEKQSLSLTLDTTSEKDIQKQIAALQLPDFLSKVNKKDVDTKKQALANEAQRVQAMMAYCDCMAHLMSSPSDSSRH